MPLIIYYLITKDVNEYKEKIKIPFCLWRIRIYEFELKWLNMFNFYMNFNETFFSVKCGCRICMIMIIGVWRKLLYTYYKSCDIPTNLEGI